MWQFILEAIFAKGFPKIPYFIRNGFKQHFGKQISWWATALGGTMAVIVFELGVSAFRRIYFPTDADLWQEIEQKQGFERVLEEYDPESGHVYGEDEQTGTNGTETRNGTRNGEAVEGSGKSVHREPQSPRSFS